MPRGSAPDAAKAFAHTASYDGAIANWLSRARIEGRGASVSRFVSLRRPTRCRTCAMAKTRISRPPSIATSTPAPATIATCRQLQGKELSYNNVADSDAAWECVKTVRGAGVRDRQACESLRRRDRRCAARSVSTGIRHRSHVGIRRHHRIQPSGRRCRPSTRSPRQFLEVLIAPAYTERRACADRQEGQRARARSGPAGARHGGQCVGHETGRRRLSRAVARRP